MTEKCKESLLAMAYFGMLMDNAWFGGKREGKTATIIETGEVYTYDQLAEMFKTNNNASTEIRRY